MGLEPRVPQLWGLWPLYVLLFTALRLGVWCHIHLVSTVTGLGCPASGGCQMAMAMSGVSLRPSIALVCCACLFVWCVFPVGTCDLHLHLL